LFINVVDIRKIFSLEQKKYELTNKIIIVKGEESLFAIIVDKVTDFFNAIPSQIQRVMGENYNNIIKTFYKIEEDIVNIINIPQLEETVKKSATIDNTTNYSALFPKDEESFCIMQKRRNDIAAIPEMNLETGFYGKDQYIIFRLYSHTYCIYSLFVKELISPKNYSITKIPYTPDFIKGIINLKGDFYTVINLKNFINIEHEENTQNTKEAKLIVLDSTELKLAFLVDDIIDIINISEDYIEYKSDANLDKLYIKAEAYIDNKVYNILNIEKLIGDERLYIDNVN
jgi:purine-binding chemotaxis protein CheW